MSIFFIECVGFRVIAISYRNEIYEHVAEMHVFGVSFTHVAVFILVSAWCH